MQTRRRVLVTGATGQIGYMTFRRLLDQPDEYDAYGLDRTRDASARVPGSWALDIPDDRFRVCDISDYNQVREAVEGMDVVAHLAADPGSGDWESLLSSNIIGAYNVFEACRDARVSRIVAASSITVSDGHREREPYRAMMERRHADVPPDLPRVSPDTPAEPRGIYASTKVWAESLARTYSARHGLSCLCVRIGQVERDRPRPPQGADIYVSQRDIVQILERCIVVEEGLKFGIYYGVSDNDLRWMDIETACEVLGYAPQDRAEAGHDYDV
ncbi:NAD(P)-dependent oxidoreductase [Candidatus Poribacteria bacterium]|nr:NAD(P)-dependent oxidoreductase [Candidatus Poribacteria bacterium]MBT5536681.1 NAD(P)-dependent oxidoreductase [Candidatus Poribacteria bacterium]MBT5711103.1 NAD(P)-dependent oxidoreductase [Candidatus Poribacteria bacterium]MBT7805177.1 NAD(P)-dependent oxidoreductase [Candidatus Poribacteria bacterium]